MTARFKYLLREQWDAAGRPLTQDSFARAVGMSRPRLNQVLGNVPGRGGVRRKQVAAFITGHFGKHAAEMLTELGWNTDGTFHVEQGVALTPVGEGKLESI